MEQKYDKTTNRKTTNDIRKREGAFFTPTQWVDEAHRMIESELGEDWKEKYVVWDCCAGTGNLTRDYEFKELYCSTLIEEELDEIKTNCVKFQHDFLNLSNNYLNELKGISTLNKFIGIEEKIDIPKILLKAFKENKKIVFLMNPPYGTAGNMNTKIDSHKKGISKSSISNVMKKDGMGAASQQLYAQFLYEIMMYKKKYGLNNIVIATYTKPLFLTGGAFKKFRGKFLNEFEYRNGMLFQASHFNDISSIWGISFTIWKNGISENKNEFNLELKDIINNNIKKIGNKIVYNLDNKVKASEWVREEIKDMKTHKNCIQMKSALNPNLNGKLKGSDIKSSIGYLYNHGNNVIENTEHIGLFSKPFSAGQGLPVLPINYKKCIALFTARKCIKNDWTNNVDEYSTPELRGSDIENSIGYLQNQGNNVNENVQKISLYSSVYSDGNGLPVLPKNYKKCVALFTARKSIKNNWVNNADEYSAPEMSGSDIKDSIGYFHNNGNHVESNLQFVGLYSKVFSDGHGLPILPINYKKCIALFTARKSIKGNWINDKDEYSAPFVFDDYDDWNNDCIVYSLFNTSSQQSAMRGIEFKNKVWDIKNEWFWMSKDEILKLGEEYKFDAIQYDLEHSKERFIYEELKGIKLSNDAQNVLNKACELVKKSFEYRERMHDEYPEYNLQCWDAGWYQIKKILNVYMKDELKEFNVMYKEFEGRMREGVFKYGFLKHQ